MNKLNYNISVINIYQGVSPLKIEANIDPVISFQELDYPFLNILKRFSCKSRQV